MFYIFLFLIYIMILALCDKCLCSKRILYSAFVPLYNPSFVPRDCLFLSQSIIFLLHTCHIYSIINYLASIVLFAFNLILFLFSLLNFQYLFIFLFLCLISVKCNLKFTVYVCQMILLYPKRINFCCILWHLHLLRLLHLQHVIECILTLRFIFRLTIVELRLGYVEPEL